MSVAEQTFIERLRGYVGREIESPRTAPWPVNEAMIQHWCDAVGDTNPVYTDPSFESVHDGIVAPPTMLQAWTMRRLGVKPEETGGQSLLFAELDDAGFTSVIATNCDQEYVRYLRPGDLVTVTASIAGVSNEKQTGLGAGHFVDTESVWRDQNGEIVGMMRFRMLKFRPASRAAATPVGVRAHPSMNDDTKFFWDGVAQGKLLIQRCSSCGSLRHPPRPMCGACRSLDWDTVTSSGRGEVYSFVVHHYPPIPGFETPYVVALIALEEGVRIVSNVIGVEPSGVAIGLPVQVSFQAVDDSLTVPLFRPTEAS
ncbi:MAG: bifunctional MaoC family dehydratase N-terminal/OB-fold nucleic acid binding domain-containing protein [Actinomycetota bacterium]|nr:OB-fold domain-containing protein [Actinomycetota bacterium]